MEVVRNNVVTWQIVHSPSKRIETMRGTWTTGCLAGWTFYSPHTLAPQNGRDGTKESITTCINDPFARTVDQTRGISILGVKKSINLPVWRPLRLASFLKATRAREWTTAGFLMIRPSRWRRAMLRRELARAISLISLGSSQILRFPHFNTSAARRFWSLRLTGMVSLYNWKKSCIIDSQLAAAVGPGKEGFDVYVWKTYVSSTILRVANLVTGVIVRMSFRRHTFDRLFSISISIASTSPLAFDCLYEKCM